MATGENVWDEVEVRGAFPALAQRDDGVARLYADAPGGTQVAGRVLERMREALIEHCANDGGQFRTSQLTDEKLQYAHAVGATFLGAKSSHEVVYGLNTTTLAFHFSRMLAREWQVGDEILVSRMDHDANVAPWLIAAEERGVTVRWLEFDSQTYQYRYDTLSSLITPRTRLVSCNHASNFLGTINDVARIVAAAKAVGAVTVVDAVQSSPHFLMDVEAIGCDILWTSPYKYFGPHAGLAFIRRELADRLTPLKVRPCANTMPYKHSPGTPSFEAQLGTVGAIEHMAWVGERFGGALAQDSLRQRLACGYRAAIAHETALSVRFLTALAALPSIKLFGISDPLAVAGRVPTFSMQVGALAAVEVAQHFAAHNIFVWSGSFYAYEIAGVLGVRETGVVRIGFAHYNTLGEVDAIIAILHQLLPNG
jgi:cysteine desulfurase family protein (TIGR01976 family)